MEYLKLFEGKNNEDQTNVILETLGGLVIDQMQQYVDHDITHHSIELASECFSAIDIYSILFGSKENLIMAINALFDELGNNMRIDFKTMTVTKHDKWARGYFFSRTAYRLLKYCDDGDELKSQLVNWEEVVKFMEKK